MGLDLASRSSWGGRQPLSNHLPLCSWWLLDSTTYSAEELLATNVSREKPGAA